MATIEHGDFEWDDAKAAGNEKKHGVTFVEAATVFDDIDFLVNVDPRDSARFIAVGFSSAARVLVVVHATRAERIASSLRAVLLFPKSASMPNVENDDLEIPELSAEWFERAVQPNRRNLRRGSKRAVFIAEEVAGRFGNDEDLEQALRALLEASDHVRRTG